MTIRRFNPLAILALTASDASYKKGRIPLGIELRSLADSDFDDEVGFPEVLRLSLSQFDGSFAENRVVEPISTPRGSENVVEFSKWRLVLGIDEQDLGFGASVYKLDGQNEYLVALRGTDGPDPKDWLQNASYSVPAWNRYGPQLTDPTGGFLFRPLDGNGPIPADGIVHFVGQSLGGGLAQYAAYDFARELKNRGLPDLEIRNRVSLTTFNAFAGAQGLIELYGRDGYKPDMLAGVQTAHFAIDNDLVHRLGADVDSRLEFVGENAKLVPYVRPGYGHLNGDGNTFVLGFKRYENGAPVPGDQGFLDLINSHRIESGFYAGFANYGVSFAPNAFLEPENYEYIDVSGSRAVASRFSQLFLGQNAKLSNFDAGARLTLGLASGVMLGNPLHTAALTNEVIDNLYRSGHVNALARVPLKFVNFGIFAASLLVPALNIGRGIFIALNLLSKLSAQDKTQAVELLNGTFNPANPLPTDLPAPRPDDTDEAAAARYEWMGLALAAKLSPEQRAAFLEDPQQREVAEVLARTNLVVAAYADTLLTEPNWAGKTLEQIQTAARDAGLSALELANLDKLLIVQLSDQIAAYGAADPALGAMLASAQEDFAINEFGRALANAQKDFTAKYADAGTAFGNSVLDFQDYQPIHDALLAAMRDPAFAEIRDVLKRVLGIADPAAQEIEVSVGHGANPFDTPDFNPDASPAEADVAREGQSGSYSVYLPYAAGPGGQRVRLKLEGSGAAQVQSIWAGDQVEIAADGSFELLVREGGRETSFSLVFREEFDAPAQVSVSATLVNADGQSTHSPETELNITLELGQRVEEAPLVLITGDPNGVPKDDLLTPTSGFVPDRMEGLQGRDLIGGGEGGDTLIGGPGADVIVGSGDQRDDSFHTVGFKRTEPGDDTLYAEDEVDVEAFIASSRTATGTGVRGDWLTAGRGEDVVVGSHANDALFGGGGDDLIVGGAGDDVIDGDDHYYPGLIDSRIGFLDTFLDWTISASDNPFAWIYDQVDAFDGGRAHAGSDRIYGGPGRDWIHGLGGDARFLGRPTRTSLPEATAVT